MMGQLAHVTKNYKTLDIALNTERRLREENGISEDIALIELDLEKNELDPESTFKLFASLIMGPSAMPVEVNWKKFRPYECFEAFWLDVVRPWTNTYHSLFEGLWNQVGTPMMARGWRHLYHTKIGFAYSPMMDCWFESRLYWKVCGCESCQKIKTGCGFQDQVLSYTCK